MNSLTISELAIATKGKLVIGNESDTINDVVIDSRKADKDNVFVAVIGENLDGHQFMQSAYENGCKTFIKNASSSTPILGFTIFAKYSISLKCDIPISITAHS